MSTLRHFEVVELLNIILIVPTLRTHFSRIAAQNNNYSYINLILMEFLQIKVTILAHA